VPPGASRDEREGAETRRRREKQNNPPSTYFLVAVTLLCGQQPTGGQYRSSDDWKPILAKIQSAPDLVTRMQLLSAAAQEVRTERDRARQELDTNPQSKPASEAAKTLVKVAEILKRLQPSFRTWTRRW